MTDLPLAVDEADRGLDRASGAAIEAGMADPGHHGILFDTMGVLCAYCALCRNSNEIHRDLTTDKENAMKAIGYRNPGHDPAGDALVDIEIERPVATGRDLLVEVAAVSVNPVDTKVRARAAAADGDVEGARLGRRRRGRGRRAGGDAVQGRRRGVLRRRARPAGLATASSTWSTSASSGQARHRSTSRRPPPCR